jgi:Holliday junction resolvase RusA-like endonuclease
MHTYDPSKKDKQKFLIQAKKSHKIDIPLLTPLHINIKFYMQRPKKHFRTGKFKNLLKEKWVKLPHTKKPDIDNMIKFVLDALQGQNGYFIDDSQVIRIFAEKLYCNKPRTEIMIIEEHEEKN